MVKLGGLLKQSFPSFYQTCQFSNEPAISNLTADELKAWQKNLWKKKSGQSQSYCQTNYANLESALLRHKCKKKAHKSSKHAVSG